MQKFCQEGHLTSNTIAFCLQLLTFRPLRSPDTYGGGSGPSDPSATDLPTSPIAIAPARKYRMGLLFTHKNCDFGAISVTEQNCASLISRVKSHISDR